MPGGTTSCRIGSELGADTRHGSFPSGDEVLQQTSSESVSIHGFLPGPKGMVTEDP